MKLRTGRLSGDLDPLAESFNSSIGVDGRMVYCDIEGSKAHVKMLGKCGILKSQEAETIIEGLEKIKEGLEEGKIEIDQSCEDIHTFVEGKLIEEVGEVGKKMHTARSRNDQVTTDLKLYLREEAQELTALLKTYIESLVEVGEDNLTTIMPGYTHLQAAQPVTFSHHLLAYAQMGLRDLSRLEDFNKRMNELPLGSCALAGTTYPIDRAYVAELLDFDGPCENSMDGVSDRDYVLELSSLLAIISTHLSRLAEELVIRSSQPYSFVSLSESYSTGSSIMPQKKNPDLAELIRSLSGRIIGNMDRVFIMMKGLPLAYSKDLQEDKEAIFDSLDQVEASLGLMAGMIKSLTVNKEKMLKACKDGFLNATDLADYLVNKGLPFRDAHHLVARMVKYATDEGVSLEDIPLEVYKRESDLFDRDLYRALDLEKSLKKRTSFGGPAPDEVKRQISEIKNKLKKY